MLRIARIVVLTLLAVCITTLGSSQGITTGTVSGTIFDPSGAVVPGAQIQLINVHSGLKLSGQTTAEGSFSFFTVPIGTYLVTVSANGFSTENINNIQVAAGATTNLNQVKLSIGAVEKVEVDGSAASLLETSDSQVATTFGTETVQNLPLNNGFDTVVELIPGAVATGDDGFSNSNGDNYSVNGQSGRYNNFEIDGQSNNDNSIGGPQAFFGSQDAIQQIQVITNDYSAQYGRNAGAVENYITKSGSNSFHGSAFDLYQGQFLSSLTNYEKNPLFGYCPPGVNPSTGCVSPVLPRYVENRYGGTVGGPIIKDKLFFFYSTYWDKVRQGASPSQSLPALTPDPTGLAALKSAFTGDPGLATIVGFGPYSIKQGNPKPIPGTATMETITDGSGRTASVEVAGVQRTIASIFNDQEELGRVDWQPSAKDHLFVRYFYQPMLSTGVSGVYTIAAGDFVDAPSTTHSIGADWTHTFTSHFVDQLRYSFQQSKFYFEGGAYPNCVTTNFRRVPGAGKLHRHEQRFGLRWRRRLSPGANCEVARCRTTPLGCMALKRGYLAENSITRTHPTPAYSITPDIQITHRSATYWSPRPFAGWCNWIFLFGERQSGHSFHRARCRRIFPGRLEGVSQFDPAPGYALGVLQPGCQQASPGNSCP